MKRIFLFAFFILTVSTIVSIAPGDFSGFGWTTPNYTTIPTNVEMTDALLDLIDETGVPWQGRWNPETGLPHRLFSGGNNFPISDSADLVRKCNNFIDDHPRMFGQVGSDELRPLSIEYRNKIWFAIFEQNAHGLRVDGARADFRVKNGKLAFFGADLVPDLAAVTVTAISATQAVAVAHNDFDFIEYETELVYFASIAGTPAWRITAHNDSPQHEWVIHVHAESGEIIAAYDDIRYEVYGTVYGNIHPMYGSEIPVERTLPYLFVGLSGYTADTSDASGEYWIDIDPGSGWDISGKLEGRFDKAIPIGDLGAEIFTPANDSVVDLVFNTPEADLDEMDAYYHINVVHSWIKIVEPEFTGMDYQVPVYVRETEPPCPNNAYWDGYAVHMGAGAGGYDNWGYYADVYYHEYGHGITDKVYPGGTLPYTGQSGAIDEACSDYTACTITNEPDIGEGGLLGGGGMLRSMDNDFVYPDDWEDEVHADGRIIGGAFWDTRVALGASWTDTLIHFAKYGAPEEFEAYLDEILLVDDDDGNLLNGTPNFMAIFQAFRNHGIGNFNVKILHRPLPDTEDTIGPYYAKCFVSSTLPPEESSIELSFSTDDGSTWDVISMLSTGIEREFDCYIPGGFSADDYIYYISACDTVGICATVPDSAPDYFFSFHVGTDTIPPFIKHVPLTPLAADAAPYSVEFNVVDNLGVGQVLVIWNINSATDETVFVSPDTLGNCIAAINPPLVVAGDSIGYYILACDSAAIPNYTRYPIDDYHYVDVVRAIWLDFEDDDGGWAGSTGWEWGTPTAEIGSHSGDNVWGTLLATEYESSAEYVLSTGAYDLSDWSSATLEMWNNFSCEALFDGGNVWVSSDGGMRWYVATPIGGYPSVWVDALREPGFTGESGGWKKFIFDLTPFMSGPYGYLAFRFVFKSNDSYGGHGWFIDDFAILERQIILPPGRLIAESGHDGTVPLHWKQPDPTGTGGSRSPTEYLGYNIYRADTSGGYSSTPVNASPIDDTLYNDSGVVNENTYYYRVTTVYAEGESDPTAEEYATPFNARASIWPDSLYIVVEQGPDDFDTIITIANIGSGWLDFDVIEYTFRPDSRGPIARPISPDFDLLDLLRRMWDAGAIELPTETATMVPPSPDSWRHIIHDPDEIFVSRDIRDIYAQHDVDNIWLKFDSYGPIGSPGDEYAAGFAFDIDLDPSTGSPDFSGVEYLVATGELPFPIDGVILQYDSTSEFGFDMAGFPHWIINTFDSIGIGIAKSDIENPPSSYVMAAIISNLTSIPIPDDFAPDLTDEPFTYVLTDAWWISEDPLEGTVSVGSPQEIDISIAVPYLSPGEYYAWLMIETNDRTEPDHIVPVVCVVNPAGIGNAEKPVTLGLGTPTPNPFNANCKISFSTAGGKIELEVFDIMGRDVRTLYSGNLAAGRYTAYFDGRGDDSRELPTGIYFARLSHENGTITRKMSLVK